LTRIAYRKKRFTYGSQLTIDQANSIIEEYRSQGLVLTLRQLYYRFVALGHIENSDRSYKRLGNILSEARLAGLVSWEAIEDRGRNLLGFGMIHKKPEDAIEHAANAYKIDLTADQDVRIEVWVEKQALEAVIGNASAERRVKHLACKGYMSQSEMWQAAQRFRRIRDVEKKRVVVIHLGDHDPSGVDMTRDLADRFALFGLSSMECQRIVKPAEMSKKGVDVVVHRIALNMAQVRKMNPPPNPAKLSDSRAKGYIREFGSESWELDAIEPKQMQELIRERVDAYLDLKKFAKMKKREESERDVIREMAAKAAKSKPKKKRSK
jgi:hypothetical protein